MKIIFIGLLTVISLGLSAQAPSKAGKPANTSTTKSSSTVGQGTEKPSNADNVPAVKPIETATDRYLNGSTRNRAGAASNSSTSTGTASPFFGGAHPANNAAKTFDSTTSSRNNVSNRINKTTIAGGNDTTFNVNTTTSQGGVTTNSGAVDRSGQTQFGQTNWGTSRSTVGESQWTVPPPITASFNKDFPTSNSATWTRSSVDTTIYSARYKSGAQWVTTNYNSRGQRLDMRTELPLIQPPRPVSVYIAKQPPGFKAATIYKLQVQGRPDMYEIETAAGQKIYINDDGMEVNY